MLSINSRFKNCLDPELIAEILHQLRLVVYPISFTGFLYITIVAGFLPSTVGEKKLPNSFQPIQHKIFVDSYLGGGFKYFLFSSLVGEDSHFD